MSGFEVLVISAIALRVLGSFIRKIKKFRLLSLCSWIFCMSGAWVWACALGVYSPLWIVLWLGIAFFLVEYLKDFAILPFFADVICVGCSALLSIPQLSIKVAAPGAVGFALIGLTADKSVGLVLERLSIRALSIAIGLSIVGLLILGSTGPLTNLGKSVLKIRKVVFSQDLLYLGISRAQIDNKKNIDNNVTVWLNMQDGRDKAVGAITFHGANSIGSMQPASIVLRRTLADAGYFVAAVDHPGYGESSNPVSDGTVESWDPSPTILGAFNKTRELFGKSAIIACGHSMGVTDVFRLLARGEEMATAIVFGGGSPAPENREFDLEKENYWNSRFLKERHIRDDSGSEKISEIRRRYYDEWPYLRQLNQKHPRIIFVKFGREHSNIAANRDELFEAIPGKKDIWELKEATHYFSSYSLPFNLVIGDVRVARHLSEKLKMVYEEIEAANRISQE